MKLKDIKKYVENQLDVDLNDKSRTRRNVYSKTVYYELASIYARDREGNKLSKSKIGKFIEKNHATVLHHRAVTFPIILEHEPEFKRVYDNFRKIRHTDLDDDIRQKYDVLLSDYIHLASKYNILKKKQSESRTNLHNIVANVNEDKIEMFIERIKPIIKMVNNAKFN